MPDWDLAKLLIEDGYTESQMNRALRATILKRFIPKMDEYRQTIRDRDTFIEAQNEAFDMEREEWHQAFNKKGKQLNRARTFGNIKFLGGVAIGIASMILVFK